MTVNDTPGLPPAVDVVCESSISHELESQTSPPPLSLAKISPLPIETKSFPSSSKPHNMPSERPEERTSDSNVDTLSSPPPSFPSSNILPKPDLHTSVPECVDVSEEPSSTASVPIPITSDISSRHLRGLPARWRFQMTMMCSATRRP
ncbi:hypothetical protein QCA50_008194 [Cerrena zonata]|uniref:Uncharacterized protein n=1 Tax=Cerrena zonata TaxID=2478898 RepID=A0AAW0G5K6_9APHY